MTQKEAFDMMKLGYNVFLTGSAGTGKTYLLNRYIEHLKEKNVEIGITASTGIAATHLNGITLDSWSGLGLNDKLSDEEIRELQKKMYLKIRLLGTKVLIIDEVSMIHADKLDLIDRTCKIFRNNDLPFGGMQVVFCGDFFQLPPVGNGNTGNDYIFKSYIWNHMDLHLCYLTEQFRQKDADYINILNAIRKNAVNDDIFSILIKRIGYPISSSITIPKLYTHNIDVDTINLTELDKIKEDPHTYEMTTNGLPQLADAMKKSCLSPQNLILKKNAIVMFVRNNQKEGFVNGTLGKVVNFDRQNNPIVVTLSKRKITVLPMSWNITENNIVKAEISQLPLRLAWAITVHKSQGMTLDAAEIDLSKSFLPGMGYVALSRLKTLAGLRLLGINELALRVSDEIVAFDQMLFEKSKEEEVKLKSLGWLKKVMLERKFMYRLTS